MKFFKKLFLSLCLTLSLCCGSFSQILYAEPQGGSDNFFNSGWESFGEERTSELDATTTWITAQNFGDEYVPVGNGLLILGLGATCYLVCKNRKRAKNALLCLMFMSLIGLSGCRKDPVTPSVDETVYVTFNSGQHAKTDITPLGVVTFSENDVLYVFASGNENVQARYLGSLANETGSGPSASFTGNIYAWESGERLSFFYVGDNAINTTGTTAIDFSDQTYNGTVNAENDLNNISKHYHIGRFQVVAQDDAVTRTFTGQLKNMMALAVFDVSGFDDGTNIKMLSESNLNNVMKINLDGSVEYCVAGINSTTDNQSGHIIIGKSSSNKYVALLPKAESEAASVSLAFTTNKKVSTSLTNLDIKQNGFIGYSQGSVTPLNISATDCSDELYIDYPTPTECLSNTHVFTVYTNGSTVKKVVFSQGNLVYDQGRFKQHKNAWDICQTNDNSDIKVNTVFDRFGWGASGYTFGQPIYQPYSNSTTEYSEDIGYGYGPLGTGSTTYIQSFHPVNPYKKQDWGWYQFGMGCFEEIPNSSGSSSYWRTMGANEWKCLFNERMTSSTGLYDYGTNRQMDTARFVKCTVNDIKGIIIFPDEYTHPDASIQLKYINANNGLNYNALTSERFLTLHEAGAEFLPIDGFYNKELGYKDPTWTSGCYWSCKTQNPASRAIFCKIPDKSSGITVGNDNTIKRYQGLFVRLVFQTYGPVE